MRARSRFRWLWWVVAYVSLGLGLVGIVLPVLPTVPFILLAAFAAARGSDRLHARLLADPRTGPMIRDWQAHGAVSRKAKWLATATMSVAAVLLFLFAPYLQLAIGVTIFMAIVCTWLWFRPEPLADPEPPADPGPAAD